MVAMYVSVKAVLVEVIDIILVLVNWLLTSVELAIATWICFCSSLVTLTPIYPPYDSISPCFASSLPFPLGHETSIICVVFVSASTKTV